MNKKRFGSLSVRHWAMIFALAALTAVLCDAKRRLGADGGDDDARAAGV